MVAVQGLQSVKKPKPKFKKSEIPPSLVYEILNGKKIYYRDYEAVMNGEKTLEEIMASSYLQSMILSLLQEYFIINFRDLRCLSNELGLHISNKNNLGIDLAIYEKKSLKNLPLNAKYLTIPPKIVIEVDTKGNLGDMDFIKYVLEKSRTILSFGTEKVAWILTSSNLIIIGEIGENWRFHEWDTNIELVEGHLFNLASILKESES